jgi:DNA repair protein SbcD/Mre11
MRLLHVSDWHLGATLGRVDRWPDHQQVLGEQIALARELRPHLILHTGDLFHHPRPAVEDLRRGLWALEELAAVAPVVVLAGNHDSPAMFEVFQRLLALGRLGGGAGRVQFVGRAKLPGDGGLLSLPGDTSGDLEEEIRLAPLPFVHPNALLEAFQVPPERWTAHYTDQVHYVEQALGDGLRDGYDGTRHLLLFAAHLYVGGAVFSNSERRLHVSEAYATRIDHLPSVTYAAFGHIHRPQGLPGGLVVGRYAGAPIPIDFGEEGEQKSVVVVEAAPARPARVEVVPISGGRPLRRVRGTLEELGRMADDIGRAIVLATVATQTPTSDLADQVMARLPAATLLDVHDDCAASRVEIVSGAPDGGEPTLRELFTEFLSQDARQGINADQVLGVFDRLLEAAEAEAEAGVSFDEEALLAPEPAAAGEARP